MAYRQNKYHHNLLVGASVAAGILGTVAQLLRHKNKPGWIQKAKEKANSLLDRGSNELVNRKMIWGGIAGGILAAATALLLAPKSGSELIRDIRRPFSRHTGLRRSASRHSSISRKKESTPTPKISAKKHPRRRSAAIPRKAAKTAAI